uniref:Nuclear nucleic acid-binding protein C1D n=1 Tax=Arcella intermedia TaxID=1963864 RepID=A0A6B2LJS6_9EUKA
MSNIENLLNPLFASKLSDLQTKLTPLDNAKLNITLAYTTYTLFYLFLKTQGVDTTDHPVINEINKVKSYIQKLKKVSEAPEGPKVRINQEASRRVISAALYQPKEAGGVQRTEAKEEKGEVGASGGGMEVEGEDAKQTPHKAKKRKTNNEEQEVNRTAKKQKTPRSKSKSLQKPKK